jgi:hypothetical protein
MVRFLSKAESDANRLAAKQQKRAEAKARNDKAREDAAVKRLDTFHEDIRANANTLRHQELAGTKATRKMIAWPRDDSYMATVDPVFKAELDKFLHDKM